MTNDRQVTLAKCDYCGKYYEACNMHKCKKQLQQDKYIPCIHCTSQQCDSCDYHLHKEAISRIGEYKKNLESLREHFESYTDDDVFVRDYETIWEILKALEMVK